MPLTLTYEQLGLVIGLIIFVPILVLMIYNAVKKDKYKKPTFMGCVVSFCCALLPLYLLFCVLGWMGEKRD